MTDSTMSLRTLGLVYAALMAFLALAWGFSFLALGRFALVLTLAISLVKAVLVLLYFMELKHKPALVRLFAVTGFYFLLIMFLLALSDYLTREMHAV